MKPVARLLLHVVCVAATASGCSAQSESTLVLSSDPELGAMAAELLPDLSRRAGMELREPVRLELRSREELARYLTFKLDEDLPHEEADARVDAYALLGLVPPDLDLRALLLELYGEQVAGFYEPDSTALYVLDDQPPAALEALLVHELVHAVQDQSADLRALTDPDAGNDRSTAAMAAVEGHATLVMLEYLTEQMTGAPVDLGAVPDFAAQVGPALEGMSAQFPALAGAPRVVRDALVFPYVAGAAYVQRLWTDGRRKSPFGDAMPRSTEQVRSPWAEPPVELSLTIAGEAVRLADTLGFLELTILLEDVVGMSPARAASVAAGWDGDRWALVGGEGDAAASLAWAVVWEGEGERDRFLEAVRGAGGRFGGSVRAEPLSVDGRPGSLLRLGERALEVAVVPRSP